MSGIAVLVVAAGAMAAVFAIIIFASQNITLNGIRSRTVGDGQHGTARWATKSEIRRTYRHIPFTPQRWRKRSRRTAH